MSANRGYLRFKVSQRVEHWLLFGSFTTLALTGLVQKFAQAEISIWLVGILGGIETVRIIHRIAATVLMLESIYHLGTILYQVLVKRSRPGLWLTGRDIVNGIQLLLYNVGLRSERPQQGKFTVEEKVEYYSLVWGTLVMIITGFMLWNPIATTSSLPGQVIPAAKAVHGGEALLAVLAIILWHFYHVHVRHFNRSMFTGYLSKEEMEDEHPLELARVEAGEPPQSEQPDAKVAARSRVFTVVYGVVALALLAGVYYFISFEQTALETVPRATSEAALFAQLTPVPQIAAASFDAPLTSWDDGIGDLFQAKCSVCHGGTIPLADLDLTSYETTVLSDTDIPAVVPSNAAGSNIILQQQTGDHPALFTPIELAKVYTWIELGAPRAAQEE